MYRQVALIAVLIFCSSSVFAQTVIIDEDFSDGDFTNNPTWTDSEGKHIVDASNLLQLDAPAVDDEAVISTSSTAGYGEWEALINLDFATSSTSLTRYYLISNTESMKGDVEGYYIQVGDTDDEVSLYRQDGSSSTKIIDGTDKLIDSSPVNVRVKATRDINGNWELLADATGGTSFTSQGATNDNTYATSDYIGLFSKYIGSRSTDFEYDDIKVTKVNPPLEIQDVAIVDNQTLDVTFNLNIDPASVDAADFSADNSVGSPNTTSLPSSNVVRLSYSSALASNRYTLTVNNVDDTDGNTIDPNTTENFILFGTVAPGDIIINEFMKDPPGGQSEYVELRNTSGKILNLQNWALGDDGGADIITSGDLIIEADSFLVISDDTTSLFNAYGNRAYFEMGTLDTFNNTSDVVQVNDDNGSQVDSLMYTPEWGGDNVSLERRSATAPSIYKKNFGDSPNPLGGTPGLTNEILNDDTDPPVFAELTAINNSSFQLIFSETLDSGTATDASNYNISPNRNIQLISSNRDTVILFVDPVLQSGQTYDVTVSNIEDIFGNMLNNATLDAEYLEFSGAQPGDLRINEILYSRASGGGPEFVELFNPTNKNIDLSGWIIGDASGTTSLGTGTQLQAGEYLVLTDDINFANSLSNGHSVSNFPSLNDSGDDIYIRTDQDVTIDSVAYRESWGGGSPGESLERIDPLGASNDANNFRTSTAQSGNTAGTENTVFEVDQEAPRIIFAKSLSNGNIEVQFNEFIQLTQNLSFTSSGTTLNIINFDPNAGNVIELSAPSSKSASSASINITAQNLTDVRGNVTATDEIPVAQKLKPANIVINEILFNPLDEPDDNLPDQNEYIELRNTTDDAVSLEGIFIHDAPDEDDDVRSIIPVSTQAKWIPAQGVMLIYADEAQLFEDSQIAEFFELSSITSSSLIRADRSSLSLASSGDAVYLADSTGATVDSVFYDENWHNPNLVDTRGIALERINPGGPSNDESNWSSSTNPKGGTPSQENTIYQTPQNQPQQTGITFDPNPFSPDDDGTEDNLFINYQLDQPDYLIKVRIYDRYGRLVRDLADGRQAGFQGTLTWDGRKDDGSRNRIGIYIVVFEAYNSSTGKDRAFKETVVLARRLK